MKIAITLLFIVFNIIQSLAISLYANNLPHQYKTREEKRDAASNYQITDWLTFSALVEIEQSRQHLKLYNAEKFNTSDFSKSLDLEFNIVASDLIKAEVIVEYDDDKGKFQVDEALVKLELGKTEIEMGKLYLPFGKYFSHFVTAAPVEFAETRAKSIVASHSPREGLDLSVFAYNGKAEKTGSGSHSIDWGAAAEMTPAESWTIGVGYVSDLADANEISLGNNDLYTRRVGGFGAYSVVGFGDFEFTSEYITALDTFNELEADRNKPSAWNLELAHFPTEKLEWAVRLAGSKEIEDEPQQQLGIAGTWHMNKKTSLTLEYLLSQYKDRLAEGPKDELIEKSSQIAGRLSILF